MIELAVDQSSVEHTIDWLEAVRLKIFAGIKDAMIDKIEDLAAITVAEMTAAGIHRKTGALVEDILESPGTGENAKEIWTRVLPKSNMTLAGRTFFGYLGTALDEGYHVPPIDGAIYQFTDPDGETLFRRGHVAFDVKPHPFLRESQKIWEPGFFDFVEQRINEVIAEANRS